MPPAVRGGVLMRITSPFRWVRDLLRRPLRLERRGVQLHVVLGERPVEPVVDDAPVPGSGAVLRRAHRALGELLARHPEAARLWPHLAFIEQALRKSGPTAFAELPLSVLHRGLEQLDDVAQGDAAAGLDELHRRLRSAIAARTRVTGAAPLAASAPDDIDVSEASHSLFEEMERSWTGQIPRQSAPPG